MDTVTLLSNTTVVEDCEDAWTAGTNVVATVEATIIQRGAGSAKLAIAAAAGAGQIIAYENFTAKDLSTKTHLAFWIYSDVALSSGDMEIHISETNAIGGTPIKMTIPAIPANTWVRVLVTIGAGSKDAILSVGIYQNVDKGECIIYVDDIIACESNEYEILDIIGMPELESAEAWPNIGSVELLDGSIEVKRSRSRRNVTIVFAPVTGYGDLTWLHDAVMYYPSLRILYPETSTANVFEDEVEGANEQAGFAMPRHQGIEFLKGGGPLSWREKTPIWSATRRPPSVTVPS